ncbi:MAG: TadE/TadG family type IV pilus assembly protein [Propionicimonas sp.]|uniref:TadE/TadG family type IV pilus assembly protein n=1 Tax=Propionicimonas sp. TaxID=1955623 RepID=UPI002B20F885|nr:TadE/TadG family type IV pilus assembly protein [Propionicimonas sp.]MEA4944474.1 TadE/TadG family type IV pilus assembly protein [Propionicimonas sp.]MEA5053663.1 TadE/TadG family type IV pilus assembly protein [Propionicimonas sp.]
MTERGLVESTQWALVLPALLALVLGLVQTGVWLHGRSVATQAAAAAADLRAQVGGRTAQAEEVARSLAERGGLQQVEVRTSVRAGVVTVTVAGRAPVFFDIGQSQVVEHAVLPVERVTVP